MRRNYVKATRRLVMAGVFSSLGIYATQAWYQRVRVEKPVSASDTQAIILDIRNEVQQKELGHTLWQRIETRTPLSPGDTIRTGNQSGAKMELSSQLSQEQTEIELDADTVVTLKENDGHLSLDFEKGSVLVRNPSSTDFYILSGEERHPVASGQSVFSRDENGKTSRMDLTNVDTIRSGDFEILSPKPFDKVSFNPKSPRQVVFSWKALSRSSEVKLQAGNSATSLTEIPILTRPDHPGKLAALLSPGTHYWRLVAYAKGANDLVETTPFAKSEIMHLEVVATGN